jgi:hypothetical protein
MKLFLSALIFCPAAAIAAAWTPARADLEAALNSARETWGYTITEKIQIGMEPLNPCRADTEQSAITNVQTTTTITTTTTNGEPAAAPVARTAHSYTIRVNSNCRWSRQWLDNVVAHEYGHILIGPEYHSKDKKSIMYWIVKDHGQFVTPDDRARVLAGSSGIGGD